MIILYIFFYIKLGRFGYFRSLLNQHDQRFLQYTYFQADSIKFINLACIFSNEEVTVPNTEIIWTISWVKVWYK